MRFVPCEDCGLRKLAPFKQFTVPELGFVRTMKSGQIDVPARTVIIEPGRYEGNLYTLFSGWAFRYRITPEGDRQIVDILLPGSLIGLQQLMLGTSDSGVETLTPVTLCVLKGRPLEDVFERYSNLSEAMVLTMNEDERRADLRLSLVARRSGPERLAYFLLEIFDRLQPLGLVTDGWCYFPLQRRHLGDLLGLSDTHVSRSMTEIRRRRLASIAANSLTIEARDAMSDYSGYKLPMQDMPRLLL